MEQDSGKIETSKNHISGSNEIQCEENGPVVSNKCSLTQEIPEVGCQEPVDEKVVRIDDSLGEGDLNHSHSKDTTFISGHEEKNFCFSNSVSNESHHNAPTAADRYQLADTIPLKHNGTTVFELDGLDESRNCTSVETPLHLGTESLVNLEHHHQTQSELCANEILSCTKPCNISNGCTSLENGCIYDDSKPDPNDCEANVHSSPSKSNFSTNAAAVCSIRFCSGCLNILFGVTKSILLNEFGLNRNNWTVEDVHDVVLALSVDLLAAVRRAFDDRGNKDSFKEPSNSKTCHCKRSKDTVFTPVECTCHSENGSLNERVRPFGVDPKFTFRDGVLVNVEPEKNVTYHCKLETLCLCSLTELIVMANKALN